MSYWDGKQIIYFSTEPWPNYPGWLKIDCGCSNGLKWGGESPCECHRCYGQGQIGVHKKTKTIALYPGGPLRGKL